MNKMHVGIIGCGFVGGSLKKWLEENNADDVKILISDPPKGFNDDIASADIIFICLHILTEDNGMQDLTLLKNVITMLPDKPIFIRTTILPGTTDRLSYEFKKNIYFMPEFLTERTAYSDFCSQPMIFTGEVNLLKNVFPQKRYIQMTSLEAEITKYAHNVFGALKVTYFNGIHDLSLKYKCSYDNILKGVLLSGYINDTHTMVPGPDGKFGYGGKCFPKDVNAFSEFLKGSLLGEMIKMTGEHNEYYRKK